MAHSLPVNELGGIPRTFQGRALQKITLRRCTIEAVSEMPPGQSVMDVTGPYLYPTPPSYFTFLRL